MRPVLFAAAVAFTALSARAQETLTLTLQRDSLFQTLDNFGSSAAFELNEITEAWEKPALDSLARLLFSTDTLADGRLAGIGLSGFRVEIGACSYDQGSASRISRVTARSKCPLRPDGSYDWTQMEAEAYWADKAHEYGLRTLVGYSNSPPVYFTRNGLACRTEEAYAGNMKPEALTDFADYLAEVAAHFEERGTPLHYISPVNEPQWEWLCDTQEGSQWTTAEIREVVAALQPSFTAKGVRTKALITEAGSLDWIYNQWDGNALTGQLRFWTQGSPLYIGDLSVLAPQIAGHGYWTEDSDDRLFTLRSELAAAVRAARPDLTWWQTEYSFLGTGYQDLAPNPTAHEIGLFLAKVIHADLTVGQAAAWQFWETFESTTGLPRYRLVQVNRQSQTARPEKTYWALGHYSRFIRPGMRRLGLARSDGLTARNALRDVMSTAFTDPGTGAFTVVLVNYRDTPRAVKLSAPGLPDDLPVRPYLSTATLAMEPQSPFSMGETYTLPERSIATLVFSHAESAALRAIVNPKEGQGWRIRRIGREIEIVRTGDRPGASGLALLALDVRGKIATSIPEPTQGSAIRLRVPAGIYRLVRSDGTLIRTIAVP